MSMDEKKSSKILTVDEVCDIANTAGLAHTEMIRKAERRIFEKLMARAETLSGYDLELTIMSILLDVEELN